MPQGCATAKVSSLDPLAPHSVDKWGPTERTTQTLYARKNSDSLPTCAVSQNSGFGAEQWAIPLFKLIARMTIMATNPPPRDRLINIPLVKLLFYSTPSGHTCVLFHPPWTSFSVNLLAPRDSQLYYHPLGHISNTPPSPLTIYCHP